MNPSAYKRLPGRGVTWGGPSRVWLGEDHVLLVLTRGYVETYRRFFFNDIQALVVRQTQVGKIWNAVWAMAAGFFLLIAVALNGVAMVVMLCFAAPFVAALIINVALGPTCAFYVRTAVQAERLAAVSRTRAAEKFIARIQPLITAAQGELPREELAVELALVQAGHGVAPAAAPPGVGI
jgi:hypothetical protein